jgi:Putative Zn-dependent protease, contains TPR repeats
MFYALASVYPVKAQRINTDSLFIVAHQTANAGDRTGTIAICEQILASNPDYQDARILLSRIYLWDKRYDLAESNINTVIEANPKNFDAWDVKTDLSLWRGDYTSCLRSCDAALAYFHNNKFFLLKKAKAYSGLRNPEMANETLNILLYVDPQNADGLELLKSLQDQLKKNRLSISYSSDYFQSRALEPWRTLYLQYSRKIPRGTLVGRLNYAKRFGIEGVQGEADAYLKISNWNYGYLNAGYSNQSTFPRFRLGGEFYQKLPSAFEASVGFRYLDYKPTDAMVYTAYLGKYLGNWWLSGRSYFKLNGNTSLTALLQARYYFASRDDYWGVRLNYGVSPDERTNVLTTVTTTLKSSGIRLEYSKLLWSSFAISGAFTYSNTEWMSKHYRNVYSGEIVCSYQF